MSKDQNPSDKACDAYFDNPYAATSGSYYSDRVTFYAGFKSGAANRDAEVVSLTNQRDYEYVRAENAAQERDQLREQVTELKQQLYNLQFEPVLLSEWQQLEKERDEWKARAEFSYKQRDELERDLLNLVCRIHRDGGHYIAKYGEARAIADADTVAAQNNADLDALQDDNAELVAALEHILAGSLSLPRFAEAEAIAALAKVRKP